MRHPSQSRRSAGLADGSSTACFPAASSPLRRLFFPTAASSSTAPPGRSPPRSRVGEDLTPRFRARVRRTDTAQSVRQEPLVHALADPRRAHEIVRPRPDSGEAQRPVPRGPHRRAPPRLSRSPRSRGDAKKRGANFGASSAIFLAGHFEGTRGAPALRSATMMLAAMCNATATLAQASVSPASALLARAPLGSGDARPASVSPARSRRRSTPRRRRRRSLPSRC